MSGSTSIPPATAAQDPLALLQAQLAQLVEARRQIVSGIKPAVVLYSQGDGTKSVTYARGNLTYLDNDIASLKRQISGINPRRALGFNFGRRRPCWGRYSQW
jgi:hypothetical protein